MVSIIKSLEHRYKMWMEDTFGTSLDLTTLKVFNLNVIYSN